LRIINKKYGGKKMSCVGRTYKSKRWAKRWAEGRPIRKVKGGYKILKGKKR